MAGQTSGDKLLFTPLTRAALVTKVLAGGIITIMGVPPGTGVRAGIDRNFNGVLDGDEPQPSLRIARAASKTLVAWSTNAAGFVLEAAPVIPATNWSAETSLRAVVGNEFTITNTPAQSNRFFRLKEL